MARKPSNLFYSVDEKPPKFVSFVLGLQHVFILFIALIFPVLIVRQLGGTLDPRTARGFISFSMVAGGATTILQALKKGPVGSGYLCPSVCGPSYMSASMMAASIGGLPLLFGMTGFVGVVEAFFSRIMHKLRFLFPSEVTGVIVAMVGIVVIPLSVKNFVGLGETDSLVQSKEVIVAIITFATMVALNIYSKGKLRLYCTIIGMIVGYIFSFVLGVVPQSDIVRIQESQIIAFPHITNMSWKFDFRLVIPFIIATLCSTLKTVGDLVTCQKINDADWKRPEMKSISGGILADGLGGIIPGIIGGFGQSTSSTNVGLSMATGATSRRIAYFAGAIFIALAFLPKLAQVFIIMPKPVMGATLIFSVSFMIVAGFQIIMSRMLDSRKIFVVGTAIIFGLSADMVPGAYANVHHWIQPVFSSSLSLGAVTAIILNLIFRIGIKKRKTLELVAGEDSTEKIFDFMEKVGGMWGARKEIIYNAISAMNEFYESVSALKLTNNKIKMDINFDELSLNIDINYEGEIFEFPETRPSKEELKSDDRATVKLSGFMIRQYVDSFKTDFTDGFSNIHLHFEH